MFGARGAYFGEKLYLVFCDKPDPWNGVLICTDDAQHASLQNEFPALISHPVLGKWLHLADCLDDFESQARRLVALAQKRDPRIGVLGKTPKASRNRSLKRTAK